MIVRPLNRLELIDKIGRELQARMTTSDINVYLGAFGVETEDISMASSKWVYVKRLLSDVDESVIIKIASDLGLDIPSVVSASTQQLRDLLDGSALQYCQEDFDRALQNVETDPSNAIGMASTTLESICKAILDGFGKEYPKDESLQSLLKSVQAEMNLSPEAHADPEIKRILGGLVNAAVGIATLRTRYSTFHGKGAKQLRLGQRHARLAVNALATVGLFLLETFQDRFAGHL